MQSKFANLVTFLLALLAQVGIVWQDQSAPLGSKLFATAIAVLGLAMSKAKLAEVEQIALAVATAAGSVLVVALPHLAPGSKAAALGSVIFATATSLRVLLSKQTTTGAAGLLVFVLVLSSGTGCHNVKPDQFFGAVVDCSQVNPEASAALGAVTTCLVGLVSQNPAVCLSGLLTDGHFSLDEIACVVASLAHEANAKVGASTATLEDLKLRKAANDWLAQEQIGIRNTYKVGL
jgi:hypothetical protein